ncbi:hypothetical protein J8A13_24005, partial [Vibrio parahaemolyticus]|nr:hypothetical protein [Vibrio parahaemolyticus]
CRFFDNHTHSLTPAKIALSVREGIFAAFLVYYLDFLAKNNNHLGEFQRLYTCAEQTRWSDSL